MKPAFALFPVRTVALLLVNVPAHASSKMDSRIEASAKMSYVFQTYLKGDDIKIQSKDGFFSLRGDAASEAQKELTTEYAKDVTGVKDVKNEMTVSAASEKKHETVGEKIDDASITALVKLTLLNHRSTSAVSTKVKTTKGVVTVSGKAGTQPKRTWSPSSPRKPVLSLGTGNGKG